VASPVNQTIRDAVDAIRKRWPKHAQAGLILGTGMGKVAEAIENPTTIAYEDLPGFASSTAIGHQGRLVCGQLAGASVIAMAGRCHLYEGYRCEEITLPVYVMRELGAELLIASNASGGMNPKYSSGDIMVMESHINLLGGRGQPKIKDAEHRCGPTPYDAGLISQSLAIARSGNFAAHQGVYVAMTGPNYETRAEYRFLRKIGGDVVGMSTVPEVLVAASLGMRVLALSTVTNVATPDSLQKTSGEEVVAAAESAEPKLRKIVSGVLATLKNATQH